MSKVLVIGDDLTMTEMLRQSLAENAFEVLEVFRGPEGIKAARQMNPEVIVVDLVTPDMEGWEICRSIRTFSQAPILVLSAMNKPGMVAIALDEGIDDFLLKPIPSSVLLAHLRGLARRARAEKAAEQISDRAQRDDFRLNFPW